MHIRVLHIHLTKKYFINDCHIKKLCQTTQIIRIFNSHELIFKVQTCIFVAPGAVQSSVSLSRVLFRCFRRGLMFFRDAVN